MLTAFDEGVVRISQLIAGAAARERGWRERVFAGLSALLRFFDEEPGWARFLILESAVATVAISQRRQRALTELARTLEREARAASAARWEQFAPSSELAAELVVGGAFSVVKTQILDEISTPLADLAPSLMSFIVRPYQRADRGGSDRDHPPVRATYRTARVLGAIAASPRSNNREIASAAGLRDEGQTSKLLSRLARRGLVENVGLGAAYGEPNAWLLTAAGERVLRLARRPSAADARAGVGQGAAASRGAVGGRSAASGRGVKGRRRMVGGAA